MSQEFEQAIFAVAHTNVRLHPFHNDGRTLRLVVQANINTHALSVEFANYHGEGPLHIGSASIGLCNRQGVLRPDSLMPLTVGGVLHFELEPGARILSDQLRFSVQAGDYFALNVYYPSNNKVYSGNWVGQNVLRSKAGNFSADLSMHGPGLVRRMARTVTISDMTVPVTTVSQIIAHTTAPSRVVGCFGDSITQQGNWTVPFTKRLARAYPGQISLCNLGISGNRLLFGSPPGLGETNGIAGIERFERDLLRLPGLTHAILELGTNDIGLPGQNGADETEVPTLEEYIATMSALANQLHKKNVKVFAATLAPRPLVRPYTEERELLRLAMNEWLRGTDAFDGLLDFDTVLRRDDGKPGIREGYALPDGLHPSPLGGLWMAKSIDLELFGGALN